MADPCITFDPSNVLHCSQDSSNQMVAIVHSYVIWSLFDPCMTFDPSNALHSSQDSSNQIW